MKQLEPTLPERVMIDVLRQAAKSCVLKREFHKAGLLIRQALYLAKEVYDMNHPVYSNVLIDYGFYLLNFDSIINSVTIYKVSVLHLINMYSVIRSLSIISILQIALNIRKAIFGKMNLHVALAHEDLAYALYVVEYTSGKFHEAR